MKTHHHNNTPQHAHAHTHTHTQTHTHTDKDALSGWSAHPATSLVYKLSLVLIEMVAMCVWSLATGVCTVRGTSETHTLSPHTRSQNVNCKHAMALNALFYMAE